MAKVRSTLDLSTLTQGIGQLPPAFGLSLAEQSGVCLEEGGHESGCVLSVTGQYRREFSLSWPQVGKTAHIFHQDENAATENGAYGVAIALIHKLEGLVVLQRSWRTTGFDFWLGAVDSDDQGSLFQNKARLEVSGIRRGSRTQVRTRVKQKIAQTQQSASTGLPARVIVVEFGEPVALVGKA